jgi:imidazolonepropionase
MTKPKVDLILSGAGQVLTCVSTPGDPIGRQGGVEIAIQGDRIAAISPRVKLEEEFDLSAAQVVEAADQIVAPGFIDCHTHLVFGGSRAQEYAARLTRPAQEVAALGFPVGIQATVRITRESSPETLLSSALARLGSMLRYGTTTLESKSGYGLSVDKEIELLEVNQKLQAAQPIDIVSTFLGAHDFPPEISRDRYLELLIEEMIPRVAEVNLAEFCDVYCDDGYYTVEESRRILRAGLDAGLRPKIHVDAYANIGGSAMAADLRSVSADHLNYTTEREIERLAEAGVAGVVMPGLDFAVRHPHPFNARRMLDQGLTLALATDFCPGCWMESMQLVMQLACRQYQFSPEEALLAATTGGALALGLADRGVLAPGTLADLQVWDVPTFEDVVYRLGHNAVSMVIKRGRVAYGAKAA